MIYRRWLIKCLLRDEIRKKKNVLAYNILHVSNL